nr:T9SS type A sorting domain-containing protein [Carboxylicivirga mesophila]
MSPGGTKKIGQLGNGAYCLEVFFDGSLCPVKKYFVFNIEPIKITNLTLNTYTATDGTIYYTNKTSGGKASGTISITGRGTDRSFEVVEPAGATLTYVSGDTYKIENIPLTATQVQVSYTGDSNGCVSNIIDIEKLTAPSAVTASKGTVVNVDCHGNTTGQIPITITNGFGPFKIELTSPVYNETVPSHNSTSKTFTNLAASTYSVTVTDLANPANTSTITSIAVTEPDVFTIENVNVSDVSCNGGTDGSVNIVVSGGTETYSFSKDNVNFKTTSSSFTDLSEGSYNFYVKDANGCTDSQSKVVSEPDVLSITPTSTTNVNCPSSEGGSYSFMVNGGHDSDASFNVKSELSDPVFFNQDFIGRTITLTGLKEGEYTITITNSAGCSVQHGFKIEELNTFNLQVNTDYQPLCDSQNTGVVELTISNGVPLVDDSKYKLFINGTQRSNISEIDNVSGLSGTMAYTFKVEDEHGCTDEVSNYTIGIQDNPVAFAAGFPTSENSSCAEGTDGVLKVQGVHGKKTDGSNTSGYQYSLDDTNYTALQPASQLFEFKGKTAGAYTLYIKDEAGCVVQKAITLTNNVDPLASITPVVTDESCPASDNGVITLNNLPTNWTDNLSFTIGGNLIDKADKITPDKSSFVYNGLDTGIYPIVVRNTVNQCEESFTANIANLEHDTQIAITSTTTIFPACDIAENGELGIDVQRTGYTGSWSISLDGGINDDAKANSNGFDKYYTELDNATYNIVAIDNDNCRKTVPVSIELSDKAVKLTTPIITKPTCLVAHNGSIEVSAIDGVWKPGNIYDFYLIDNTDASLNQHVTGASAIFTGLYPNHNYNLKVEDAEGCADEKVLGMIGHLPIISISEPIKTAPLCYQDENGAIDVAIGNIYEARVNYTYELFKADAGNNYQSLQSFTDKTESYNKLGDGRYMLKVSGDDNCSATYKDLILTEPQKIVVDNRQYSCISTHGQKAGWFGIDFSLGSLNYVIEWIKADGTKETQTVNLAAVGDVYHFKREDLGPGDYTFRLKDKNECDYFDGGIWYETSVTITEPEPLEISFSKVDESCTDYSDGQIVISASGGWLCPATEHTDCQNPAHDNCPEWQTNTCGTQDYLYSIDATKAEWQCEPVFQSLAPGTYDISVMDKAGNITTTQVEILARPKLSFLQIDAFPASCPGYDNGRIAATIDNGVFITDHLDYTIRETVSGDLVIAKEDDRDYHYGKLFAGTYTLEVIDLNGCVDAQDFTIGEPEVPEISITHNYIRRKGEATGEIDVEVVKGNGVFNYEWYKDAEAIVFENGQTIKDISLRDLLAGTYTLKVQDTAQCVYEVSDWMERQVQIIEPELPLSFTVKENSPVTCNGLSDGILEVTPIGGWGDYTYAINGEPEQASPRYEGRPAGNYTITVKDSAGITWQNNIELAQPEVLTASFRAKQDVRCFDGSDGSIELAINGGNLSYQVSVDNTQWYDGMTVPDLSIGTYTVYVQDPKNCLTQVDNITLNQPTEIQLLDSTIIKSRCSNNEGQIFSSYKGGVGAYTYKWQKGIGDDIVELPYVTADITDLYSGLYTIEVRDAHDCLMKFNFPLGDITDLAIESIDVTDVSCWDYSDGEVQATVVRGNPAYTYTWSEEITASDQNKAWGMKAGTYYLMVTDEKKCNAVREFTVGTPDSLYYSIVDMEHPLCLGGEQGHIEIQGTGGTPAYEYQWSTGSTENQLKDVVPGDYVLGITDAHNCFSQFTIPFDYQRTVVPFVGNDTLICHYDALPLDAGQYEQFKWTSLNGFRAKEQQVVVTEPDTYYLEVTDADKCLGYDTLKLDVSYLQITNLNVKDVTCNKFGDGEAHVEVLPATWAHSIEWTDASSENTWLNLSGGDYSVRVFDEYGCEDKRDFSVYEPDALALNVNKLMQPLCFGVPDGRIELEAIGGVGDYRYEWLHETTKSTITKLDTGTYVVDLYDANNCHLRESYEMTYVRTIYPKLGDDLTVCEGNNAKLYPGEFYGYQWFKNDVEVGTDTALIVSEADSYWVEVQDEDNCIGRDTMSLSTYATDVAPEFLTATSVAAGDTLIMVEVTQPKPQHIDWAFTGEYNIVEQGAYFCKVIFNEQGMREITLNAHTSNCFAQARKTILVTPPGSGSEEGDELADKAYQNLLKLGVSPNPTDGFFTVSIELSEKAPVNIYLVSLGTGQILEQCEREGMDIYSETFNLSIPGMYVVVVESNGEKRVGKVIVN